MNIKILRIKDKVSQEITDFILKLISDSQVRILGETLDPHVMTETVYQYITSEDKVFFIAMVDDRIVGCFLGESKFYPFSKIPISVELYFSVLKEYRGLGIFKWMLNEFEAWSIERGCRFMICGVNYFSSSSAEQAIERLQKEGFIHFGKEFYRELK